MIAEWDALNPKDVGLNPAHARMDFSILKKYVVKTVKEKQLLLCVMT